MAYQKRNFKKDQLLTADDLNAMDDQIASNEESAKKANDDIKNKLDKSAVVQEKGNSKTAVMSQAAATVEFDKLSEDIDDVKETLDSILSISANESIDFNNINLSNGFINQDGTITDLGDNNAWFYTDFLDVSGCYMLKYTLTGTNTGEIIVANIATYDNNRELIDTYCIDRLSSVNELYTAQAVLSEQVRYIRISSYRFQTTEVVIYRKPVVKQMEYGHCVKKPYSFNGKHLSFFGDSITEGYINGVETTVNGYPKLFSDKVGATFTNNGIGSATLSVINDYPSISQKIALAFDANSYVTFIAGGVNDWQLGVSLSTFREALETICTFIKQQNYNGDVVFITPINECARVPIVTPVATLQDYRNIISEVALKNGFSVLQGNLFPMANSESSEVYQNAVFGDKLHPTELGYTIYANSMSTILL